ncbi:hypothetical protein SH1V18_13820 [Vallitalea longa]|uniref:Uncharacterized protein n=1 Tax=Vallitalea longa TaxID=2936439 RepID=A0A9W5Y8Q1_9FIRM|nr:DUF4878 domain-containing protein [Vallitalea longa]GKX28902.1 hypothetical protein SH1V18_13820 [Vallitalea longa]
MKKCFLISLLVLSLLLFQGCSNSKSPDDDASKVVKTFMDNLIEGNYKDAYDSYEEFDEDFNFDELKDNPMMDIMFGKLKYKVVDSEISEDTATVTLNVTHVKSTEIMKLLQQSMLEFSSQIFDGSNDIVGDGEEIVEAVIGESQGITEAIIDGTEGMAEAIMEGSQEIADNVIGQSEEAVKEIVSDVLEEQDKDIATEESKIELMLKLIDDKWVIDKESDLSTIFGMDIN